MQYQQLRSKTGRGAWSKLTFLDVCGSHELIQLTSCLGYEFSWGL